jgi:hypothetical protein
MVGVGSVAATVEWLLPPNERVAICQLHDAASGEFMWTLVVVVTLLKYNDNQ